MCPSEYEEMVQVLDEELTLQRQQKRNFVSWREKQRDGKSPQAAFRQSLAKMLYEVASCSDEKQTEDLQRLYGWYEGQCRCLGMTGAGLTMTAAQPTTQAQSATHSGGRRWQSSGLFCKCPVRALAS